MNKVTPFLMFNDQLEAAIAFYTATFPDAEIKNVARTAVWRLEGRVPKGNQSKYHCCMPQAHRQTHDLRTENDNPESVVQLQLIVLRWLRKS